jgi:hypothetical protein
LLGGAFAAAHSARLLARTAATPDTLREARSDTRIKDFSRKAQRQNNLK